MRERQQRMRRTKRHMRNLNRGQHVSKAVRVKNKQLERPKHYRISRSLRRFRPPRAAELATVLEEVFDNLGSSSAVLVQPTRAERKIYRRWRRKLARAARFDREIDEEVQIIAEDAERLEPFLLDIEARITELQHLRDLDEISLEQHLELLQLESELQRATA
jgi:hypothetical protein